MYANARELAIRVLVYLRMYGHNRKLSRGSGDFARYCIKMWTATSPASTWRGLGTYLSSSED